MLSLLGFKKESIFREMSGLHITRFANARDGGRDDEIENKIAECKAPFVFMFAHQKKNFKLVM